MNGTRLALWTRQVFFAAILDRLGLLLYLLAYLWRRSLLGTRFILVTGSLGKTTTKECLANILAKNASTYRSKRNQNAKRLLLLNILRVRPWHRFAVIEAGTSSPGTLSRATRLIRPEVAIIVGVGPTHRKSFDSLEAIAQEKLTTLRGIVKGGVAILNDDEELLRGITQEDHFRVLRFGTSESCHLSADRIRGRWPDRLSFRATSAEERYTVKTCLVGTHWVPPLLASLLASQYLGIASRAALDGIAETKPFPARMQPVELPCGAVVIRDEYNGSPPSFQTSLEAFESAEAERKILVAGDYSDSTQKRRRRLSGLGREAARFCDLAVFIGHYSHHSVDAALREGMDANAIFGFTRLQEAVPLLKAELRKGDLVLLKSRSSDHLSRLLFAQVEEVLCWRPTCPKRLLCDICWELGSKPSELDQIRTL